LENFTNVSEKEKKNITKLVDDAYEILKIKREIQQYLKKNKIDVKDIKCQIKHKLLFNVKMLPARTRFFGFRTLFRTFA
jgi:hypothetical protein